MSILLEKLSMLTAPSRELDLSIERFFNTSSVHDNHLDHYPDSAKKYTSSLDNVLTLLPKDSYPLIAGGKDRCQASIAFKGGLGSEDAQWVGEESSFGFNMATALITCIIKYKLSLPSKE